MCCIRSQRLQFPVKHVFIIGFSSCLTGELLFVEELIAVRVAIKIVTDMTEAVILIEKYCNFIVFLMKGKAMRRQELPSDLWIKEMSF